MNNLRDLPFNVFISWFVLIYLLGALITCTGVIIHENFKKETKAAKYFIWPNFEKPEYGLMLSLWPFVWAYFIITLSTYFPGKLYKLLLTKIILFIKERM